MSKKLKSDSSFLLQATVVLILFGFFGGGGQHRTSGILNSSLTGVLQSGSSLMFLITARGFSSAAEDLLFAPTASSLLLETAGAVALNLIGAPIWGRESRSVDMDRRDRSKKKKWGGKKKLQNSTMEPIDNIGEEYHNYWETKMFLHNEELDSWAMDEAFSGYYDSSSPDGAASSAASKNIVSERNRRKKLNERLFALRAVVPNITKMDKASIIKDAINYIQELHEQERRIQAEIAELELESGGFGGGRKKKSLKKGIYEMDLEELPLLLRSKKKKVDDRFYDSSPIELLELRVAYMGEKTVLVSLTCGKRSDTMVRLCEMFESLKLKVITANITTVAGRLLKTVFVEAEEEEKEELRNRIEAGIAALNDPHSPMSM